MISAILLAAGESRRMKGEFKPLMKWGKSTVIDTCIKNLKKTSIEEIIVVLGYREADVRVRLAGAGVSFAINRDYQKGMLSSIKTGLAMVSSQTDGFLIALVDQPMISAKLINRLAIIHDDNADSRITVPVYHGKHGHPIVVSRDFEPEIMALDDNAPDGLNTLLRKYRNEITEVEVDTSAILDDLDTPEEYQRYAAEVQPVYEHRKWQP
jgi:CTP:molybdopterin cytidylyltransferase MocA